MKFWLCVIAVFVLIATNPSLEQHRAKIRVVAAEQVEREATGFWGGVARLVGLTDLAASAFALDVYRANLGICSFGMYDGKIVSFGALGCVIVR